MSCNCLTMVWSIMLSSVSLCGIVILSYWMEMFHVNSFVILWACWWKHCSLQFLITFAASSQMTTNYRSRMSFYIISCYYVIMHCHEVAEPLLSLTVMLEVLCDYCWSLCCCANDFWSLLLSIRKKCDCKFVFYKPCLWCCLFGWHFLKMFIKV